MIGLYILTFRVQGILGYILSGLGFRVYTSAMCCEGLGRASSVQACGKGFRLRAQVQKTGLID